MSTAGAALTSPARIELAELIGLKRAGESLRVGALRVRALDSGGHLSRFKGRGVEFDESRPYEPGDDLRHMDWRVTARTGKPHTKVFREERDRPVILWLDLRRPMLFATRGAYKAVRAAQTAALVAWSAVANGDRLGGLVFSEHEHVELRPRLGHRAALRLFRVLTEPVFWTPQVRGVSRSRAAALAAAADPGGAAGQPDLSVQRLSCADGFLRAPPAPAGAPQRRVPGAVLRPGRAGSAPARALPDPYREPRARHRHRRGALQGGLPRTIPRPCGRRLRTSRDSRVSNC